MVINAIQSWWEKVIRGYLFASVAHIGKAKLLHNVNQLCLGTEQEYYNSDVLLIDLKQAQQEIKLQVLFEYVKKQYQPDLDILKAL